MLEQLLAMMRDVEQNDEFFDLVARMMKRLYDALIRAGFNAEQATSIVTTQGTGLKSP